MSLFSLCSKHYLDGVNCKVFTAAVVKKRDFSKISFMYLRYIFFYFWTVLYKNIKLFSLNSSFLDISFQFNIFCNLSHIVNKTFLSFIFFFLRVLGLLQLHTICTFLCFLFFLSFFLFHPLSLSLFHPLSSVPSYFLLL